MLHNLFILLLMNIWVVSSFWLHNTALNISIHVLHCTYWITSFVNCLFKSLAHFSMSVFTLFICRGPLCILDKNSVGFMLQIFFYSTASLFTLLIVSFGEQKLLISLPLWLVIFASYLINLSLTPGIKIAFCFIF